MRVGLFIPCYVDQFFPEVGLATVALLERFGCECDFPPRQTCCGQPMANSGFGDQAAPLARRFVEIFEGYDYIVAPSGSCVSMVRNHYAEHFAAGDAAYAEIRARTFELCEFLTEILNVETLGGSFTAKVALHQSCHGLRELRLGNCSELMTHGVDRVRRLLLSIEGVEIVELQRADECCGFGGTFAVVEEGVSVLMGKDRVADFRRAGAEVITATDSSCLMHLQGIARRQGAGQKYMHVAEIFAAAVATGQAAPTR